MDSFSYKKRARDFFRALSPPLFRVLFLTIYSVYLFAEQTLIIVKSLCASRLFLLVKEDSLDKSEAECGYEQRDYRHGDINHHGDKERNYSSHF